MSIGTKPVTFNLNENPVTVVIGDNGVGKSTGLIDALYFCLFGKPFRKDFSVTDLLNDEVKKDLYTECEFSSNGVDYVVKRGRKSDVEFEIIKGGKLVPVPADLKQYQKYLEETVLGCDSETFKQVVILGSSAYIPFMKLDTSGRRKVVEDLLAIRIFSFMNEVAKDDAKEIRAKLEAANHTLGLSRQKHQSSIDNLANLKSQASTNVDSHRKNIDTGMANIEKLQAAIVLEQSKIDVLQAKIVDPEGKKLSYTKAGADVNSSITKKANAIKGATFYKDNTICPECKQDINTEFRKIKLNEYKEMHAEAAALHDESLKMQEDFKNQCIEIRDIMQQVSQINDKIRTYNGQIQSIQMTNNSLQNEINRQSGASSAHMVQAEEMVKTTDVAEKNAEMLHSKLLIDQAHINAAIGLLKDDKIKGDVIRSYIPVINQHIQMNLNILEFPVTFTMDEKFKETIIIDTKKRSYAALSEGQKLRVDLAILFAWRSVAASKNSAQSSLLIFDEIASSSMDTEGAILFNKLVNAHLKDANIFNITHDPRMASEYPVVFEVKLENKFTVVNRIEI
jgi:DNA repair exonuclease SbcCD ATPase subunit